MTQLSKTLRLTWSTLMRRGFIRGTLAVTLAGTLLTACGSSPSAWYASWSAAPQDYNEVGPVTPPPASFTNQTIRQVVHLSIGGEQVRVRFSNLFGKTPLQIDSAHIAHSTGGAKLAPASDTALKFNGSASVTIPAGGEMWSDAAALQVQAQDDLAVSIFLAAQASVSTVHALALRTNYVVPGNAVSTETLTKFETRTSYYYVSGIDVLSSTQATVVVALGDSITDGLGSTPDADDRWPNLLARGMQVGASVGPVGVVNEGILGNRIITDGVGPSGVNRFERDVLGQSGVSHVLLLLGINDIAFPTFVPNQEVTVEQMTTAMQSMIDKAKAKGIKVLVGTLLPFKNAMVLGEPYYSAAFEAKRQAFNSWVRSNGSIDAVVEFDKAMQNPADPLSLSPSYDSGDHLHPNDLGAQVMANSAEFSVRGLKP